MEYNLLAALLSLTLLEIVLGLDNIVFLAIIVDHLDRDKRKKARQIGMSLALFLRVFLLCMVSYLMGLEKPLCNFFNHEFSAKDLLMLFGGLFLIGKTTSAIHEELMESEKAALKKASSGFYLTIAQLVFIDLLFSFDSVITAVGLTRNIFVIILAMTIAMITMFISSGWIAEFIRKHPTLKMLAFSFIMMVGVFLLGEGLGLSIPKGYIYFAMAFSLFVETLNQLYSQRIKRKSMYEDM